MITCRQYLLKRPDIEKMIISGGSACIRTLETHFKENSILFVYQFLFFQEYKKTSVSTGSSVSR